MNPSRNESVAHRTIRVRLALWVVGSTIGTAIVALPDQGVRLFSLSPGHGPSVLDLVGIVIILATWLPVPLLLCSRRRSFQGSGAWVAALLVLVGVGVLAVAIRYDLGASWIAPVVLLLGVQGFGLRRVWVNESPH